MSASGSGGGGGVCLCVQRVVCLWVLGRHPCPLGRYLLGRHPPGQTPPRQTPLRQTYPLRWPLQWTVRILLECILWVLGRQPMDRTPPPGQTPPRQTLQRKLRILLDCILVAYACIIFYILYLLFYSPPVGWICSISVWHLLHFCVQIISDPVEAEKTYGCAS